MKKTFLFALLVFSQFSFASQEVSIDAHVVEELLNQSEASVECCFIIGSSSYCASSIGSARALCQSANSGCSSAQIICYNTDND